MCGLLNEIILLSTQLDLFLDILTINTKLNIRLNLNLKKYWRVDNADHFFYYVNQQWRSIYYLSLLFFCPTFKSKTEIKNRDTNFCSSHKSLCFSSTSSELDLERGGNLEIVFVDVWRNENVQIGLSETSVPPLTRGWQTRVDIFNCSSSLNFLVASWNDVATRQRKTSLEVWDWKGRMKSFNSRHAAARGRQVENEGVFICTCNKRSEIFPLWIARPVFLEDVFLSVFLTALNAHSFVNFSKSKFSASLFLFFLFLFLKRFLKKI